jgi:hypothetical protein
MYYDGTYAPFGETYAEAGSAGIPCNIVASLPTIANCAKVKRRAG